MTTITAKIIADSISPDGIRLTTMQLRYPRCIHAEAKTHRVMKIGAELWEVAEDLGFMDDLNLSRNASSSRAIPVERLIQDVIVDPYVPLHWGKNQKGMQADEESNEPVILQEEEFYNSNSDLMDSSFYPATREEAWFWARDQAVTAARAYSKAGYHKQIVNRLLEPFAHINVVVTATEWANFLWLRDHKDAEPHIAILAREVKAAMEASTPKLLQPGGWHLPYVNETDVAVCFERVGMDNPGISNKAREILTIQMLRKLSVARCASVSYKTVDGLEMTIERATDLYDKLITAEPLHASPTEHQATPDQSVWDSPDGTDWGGEAERVWKEPKLHGNLKGWIQFRKTLPNENVTS